MDKDLVAIQRQTRIIDPDFNCPAATRIFFQGSREEQERALSKLRRKVLANRATEVVCWGVAIGTLGAFIAPASQPNPTLFAAAMGGVVVGGVASLLSIANIAGRNAEGTLEQSDDVWRAASQMVGEPIPSAMADRLRKRLKRG